MFRQTDGGCSPPGCVLLRVFLSLRATAHLPPRVFSNLRITKCRSVSMGGNTLSKSKNVGLGKHQEGTTPPGAPFYYPVTNFFITNILAPLHYWNYFQGCGPFNLSGCDDLHNNIASISTVTGDYYMIPSPGYLKMFWVLVDFVAVYFLISGGIVIGIALDVLSPIISVFESLFGDLFTVGADALGWIFSFFESGATYIMQFLGFAGSVGGQSLFGLVSDVTSSLTQASGVPAIMFYILFGELFFEAVMKIIEDTKNSGAASCIFTKIYSFFNFPFHWLTTDVFNKGFIHDLLSLLFLPPRLLFALVSVVIEGIYCNFDPKNSNCNNPCS